MSAILKRLRGSKVVLDDYDEAYTETFFVRVPKDATKREVYEAARRYETHCQHSRDCCGRYYASVHWNNVRRVKRGEYAITLSFLRNI